MAPLNKGFTLLEAVLGLAITALVLVFALSLYRGVVSSTAQLLAADEEIATEQFVRQQLSNINAPLTRKMSAFSGKRQEIKFISASTALGEPAHVTYRFDAGAQILHYEEAALQKNHGAWQTVIFSGVNAVEWKYFDASTQQWLNEWRDPASLPTLAELRWTKKGQAEMRIVVALPSF
ncbi:MAG: type II secretion system protein J [Dongiaceae bacterium]